MGSPTPGRSWAALGVASASIFLFVLDAGLLSVALPDIEAEFDETSRATVSWAGTGYFVSLSASLLVAGRLADRLGRHRMFDAGLVVFGAAALATGLAPNPWLLIGARVVQGVGGGMLTATSLALVLPLFPLDRRALAVGVWGMVGSFAAVLGPTLGAVVVDELDWRLVFIVMAPISWGVVAVGRTRLPDDRPVGGAAEADAGLDLVGVPLTAGGVGLVALALSQGGAWGWRDARTIGALALGAVLLAAFADRSRRHPGAVLDLRLLAARQFTTATLSAAIQQMGFLAWFFSTSIILRNMWGWTALETGLAISAAMAASAVTGPVGGRLAERLGYPATVGLTVWVAVAGPAWWLLTIDADPDLWGALLPGLLLFGAGGGVVGIITTGAALHDLPEAQLGSANAAHQTARRLASAVGVALMVALLGEADGPELLDGAQRVWVLVLATHVVMALPMVAYPFRRRV